MGSMAPRTCSGAEVVEVVARAMVKAAAGPAWARPTGSGTGTDWVSPKATNSGSETEKSSLRPVPLERRRPERDSPGELPRSATRRQARWPAASPERGVVRRRRRQPSSRYTSESREFSRSPAGTRPPPLPLYGSVRLESNFCRPSARGRPGTGSTPTGVRPNTTARRARPALRPLHSFVNQRTPTDKSDDG